MLPDLDSWVAAWVECGMIFGGDIPLVRFMAGARFTGAATPLFDLNDELLLQRVPFYATDGAGYIDVGVHESLGNPLQKIGSGDWNAATLLEDSARSAREKVGWVDTESARFVVYNYPRVGVQFRGEGDSLILVDTSTLELVPEVQLDEVREPVSFVRWSVLDNMPPRERKRNSLKRERWISALKGKVNFSKLKKIGIAGIALDYHCEIGSRVEVTTGWLQYGRRKPNHVCFEMRAQEREPWCVAACVEMLLDFYRYEYLQEELAFELGLGNSRDPRGLPCARDEFNIIEVVERRSRGSLVASVNNCPHSFWLECQREIDESRPLILMALQHARIVAGYIKIVIPDIEFPKLGLALYNPLPLNEGEIEYWEAFEPNRCRSLYTAQLQKV